MLIVEVRAVPFDIKAATRSHVQFYHGFVTIYITPDMRLISTWRVELRKPTPGGHPVRLEGARHGNLDLLTSAEDRTMSEIL